MPESDPLLAVPNFSEGRDERTIRSLEATLGGACRVLDTHYDGEHHRSVFTLAGQRAELEQALFNGAQEAIALIDMRTQQGIHPRIGALDVCPLVYRSAEQREEADAAALALAERFGAELGVPVFLYGELATSSRRRERAYFRRGGPAELARRMDAGELAPDFGPTRAASGGGRDAGHRPAPARRLQPDRRHPEPRDRARGRRALRESGGGLPGVRAIGLPREGGHPGLGQRPRPASRCRSPSWSRRSSGSPPSTAPRRQAELVGLVPEAALDGYPDEVPIAGFEPERHVIEKSSSVARFQSPWRRRRRSVAASTAARRAAASTRPAGRPRNRAEAKARARQRRAGGGRDRGAKGARAPRGPAAPECCSRRPGAAHS